MFILRQINENGAISNTILGKSYSKITRWNDREQFNQYCEKKYEKKSESNALDNLYGFIIDNTENVFPLNKIEKSYIMVSNGETFENLSFNKPNSNERKFDIRFENYYKENERKLRQNMGFKTSK